jgi:hypothetical protein
MERTTSEQLSKAYTEHAKDITQEDLDMLNRLADEMFQRIEDEENKFLSESRQS